MRRFAITYVILFFSIFASAQTRRTPQPLDIGRDINSGFENLTCSQMIASHLAFVAASPYNPVSVEREFKSCVARERSNVVTGLLNRVGYVPEALQECLNAANRAAEKHKEIRNQFVHLLKIREEIYHVNNLTDKSFLSDECRNVTPASLRRPASMSDYEYWRKMYLKCSMKYSADSGFTRRMRESYQNRAQYEEQEICYNYRVEYHKDDIRFALPKNPKKGEEGSDSVVRNEPRCQELSCSKIMNPNGYANPSPCYRSALLNCMSGVDANSGHVVPSRSGVGTSN